MGHKLGDSGDAPWLSAPRKKPSPFFLKIKKKTTTFKMKAFSRPGAASHSRILAQR
jgi:hypothetical protein